MSDWKVGLQGSNDDLDLLSDIFQDDPKVIAQGDNYYLYSSRFDGCQSQEKVRSIAEDLIGRMWGTARLKNSLSEKPSLGPITQFDEDRTTVNLTIELREKQEVNNDEIDFVEDAFSYSGESQRAKELSEIISNGDSWVNMYRIYEYIIDNLDEEDDENIIEKGWISNSKMDQFTHTANSMEAIGYESRHAKSLGTPTNKKMEKSEAEDLIFELARTYIEYLQKN